MVGIDLYKTSKTHRQDTKQERLDSEDSEDSRRLKISKEEFRERNFLSPPPLKVPVLPPYTEGTGLHFGLSNNLLEWILFGVFGLIWALYIVYTGSLEEEEESGLSL